VYDVMSDTLNVTFTQFEQNGSNVWTLLFQMPLLSYLDVTRKRALIDIVSKVSTSMPLLSLDNVCIGTYETYQLTTFSESILIHLYSRTNVPLNVSDLHGKFENNVNTAFMDTSNTYVVPYPGQTNIRAFDLSKSPEFNTGELLHPGSTSSDGATPVNLAVFIASFPYNMTFTNAVEGISRNLTSDRIDTTRFAVNPNPINYGLEAGDYVFAVIGTLLLAVVMFLIIFGYFIHPFFIA
jgi:hypothetical protein